MKYGLFSSTSDVRMSNEEEEGVTSAENSKKSRSVRVEAAAAMASSPVTCITEADAVVFSIQFYGKTIGEVGLMDQDLSELDWKHFKSYLFQNLLSVNHQENICVSYNDDEGDKLPIDSEEEYREALKVAKKKAECHDKLILDITRQGGLPTVLSFVSSGIKKVSSSPPKEGGMAFFRTSPPPKDSSAAGKRFPFFLTPLDKEHQRGSPVQPMHGLNPAPDVPTASPHVFSHYCFTNSEAPLDLTTKPDHVFGLGEERGGRAREVRERSGLEDTGSEQPPQWFTNYMNKFRAEMCEEVSQHVMTKMNELLRSREESGSLPLPHTDHQQRDQHGRQHVTGAAGMFCTQRKDKEKTERQKQSSDVDMQVNLASYSEHKGEKRDKKKEIEDIFQASDHGARTKKTKEKTERNDTGAKRKKVAREEDKVSLKKPGISVEKVIKKPGISEEKLMKKQEKVDEKLAQKQERLEERAMRKQEKLTEKYNKLQDKLERKKLALNRFSEELDKNSRTQEKVLAKMEGLRKKQSCSPEELNKLRKMVDKHHRGITAEQRQQRRNDRKPGNWKAAKSKRISIDNKGRPVDASLLHTALQELEALAEDSPSESSSLAPRGYDALYVIDITYPDGSKVAPGAEFVKTWRVANNGIFPWNEKTALCKWTQVRFRGSPAGWKLKPSLKKVVCPPLEPGQMGDISITFTAPSEPGWYATHWRFCQCGRVFGNQMWCAVQVVGQEPPEAAHFASLRHCLDSCSSAPHCPPQSSLAQTENVVCEAPSNNEEFRELKTEDCESALEDKGGVAASPTHGTSTQESPSSEEYEVGIIENYYDAEDPSHEELTESLKNLHLASQSLAAVLKKADEDLITFEEDVELVPSRSSTPEIIQPSPSRTSVVPFKGILQKASNECVSDSEAPARDSPVPPHNHLSSAAQPDLLSLSSGSFSEFDSEDQAILNESDTEQSDQEYFMVNLPHCFDLTFPYSSSRNAFDITLPESSQALVDSVVEADRPDSPDFLTADEDERMTGIQLPTAPNTRDSCSSDATCTGSHLGSIGEEMEDSSKGRVKESEERTVSGSSITNSDSSKETAIRKASLPSPPSDTKGFMNIPAEALTAKVYAAPARSLVKEASDTEDQQEETQLTWSQGNSQAQAIVCEQPVSMQTKGEGVADGTEEGVGAGPTLPDLPPTLPEELVSIIPEDLVRGVWNTARTFITRINQEMLSPSTNSTGHEMGREKDDGQDAAGEQGEAVTQPPCPTSDTKPTHSPQAEVLTLPPPMQQLADMGFTDLAVNQRLLTKYNNDVACAVAELIVLNCQ